MYKVIGVMSGTSLDGIDLAYIHFEKKENWTFKILQAETIPYTPEFENRLKNAVDSNEDDLKQLDVTYTGLLAGNIQSFIEKYKIKEIDAVCSHGHTILHEPEKGITYQIGNLPELGILLKDYVKTVVCDFRVQDVELGGQGAPLVPIGDELLFSEYDYCLNLGGFANVSTNSKGKRIAYDICPVNIVMNHYAKQLGYAYDEDGKIAQEGTVNQKLLDKLNELQFYKESAPKSLGLEWVQKNIFPILNIFSITSKDILATFTEHVAMQIASEFQENTTVLCTGGGTYNKYLLSRIQFHKKTTLVLSTDTIIEYKEALIFGFLGILRLRNEVNCLKTVTGAEKNHSSGKIYNLGEN